MAGIRENHFTRLDVVSQDERRRELNSVCARKKRVVETCEAVITGSRLRSRLAGLRHGYKGANKPPSVPGGFVTGLSPSATFEARGGWSASAVRRTGRAGWRGWA